MFVAKIVASIAGQSTVLLYRRYVFHLYYYYHFSDIFAMFANVHRLMLSRLKDTVVRERENIWLCTFMSVSKNYHAELLKQPNVVTSRYGKIGKVPGLLLQY